MGKQKTKLVAQTANKLESKCRTLEGIPLSGAGGYPLMRELNVHTCMFNRFDSESKGELLSNCFKVFLETFPAQASSVMVQLGKEERLG